MGPYTYGAHGAYPYAYGAYRYGKRSADEENDAESGPNPDAYFYGAYPYAGYGYNHAYAPYTYGAHGAYPYAYGAYHYGKRSADADAWGYGHPRYGGYRYGGYRYGRGLLMRRTMQRAAPTP